jgi:hypothetical protein
MEIDNNSSQIGLLKAVAVAFFTGFLARNFTGIPRSVGGFLTNLV